MNLEEKVDYLYKKEMEREKKDALEKEAQREYEQKWKMWNNQYGRGIRPPPPDINQIRRNIAMRNN